MSIRTVLFDLDGTLADTAPDLSAALNRVLLDNGRAPLPFERIRPVVSNGAQALIQLGFGTEPGTTQFEALRRQLLEAYAGRLAVDTRLFPGMADLLTGLEQRGLRWGVVTNKPAFLTEPLLEQLGLARRSACIVSGDTLPERKPHPAPLLHACELTGSGAAQCIYVGDAERDIQAGRRAGMRTLIALFGYIETGQDPRDWGADALVQTPLAILDWLEHHAGVRAAG